MHRYRLGLTNSIVASQARSAVKKTRNRTYETLVFLKRLLRTLARRKPSRTLSKGNAHAVSDSIVSIDNAFSLSCSSHDRIKPAHY